MGGVKMHGGYFQPNNVWRLYNHLIILLMVLRMKWEGLTDYFSCLNQHTNAKSSHSHPVHSSAQSLLLDVGDFIIDGLHAVV